MATWMGHLRVAEIILPHFPELDPGQFTYGSLAPDFGKPLEGSEDFHPPKEISHFIIKQDDQPVFRDLLFFRNYLSEDAVRDDLRRFSFLMGYFFHLTLDGLWHEWIGNASKRDYSQLIKEHGNEAWWLMKDDWYGIDVQYAQENRDCIFWTEILTMQDFPLYLDFQDKDAVLEQMERIRELYSNPPQDLLERDSFPYLSKKTMDKYVTESVEILLEISGLIYRGKVPQGCETFLDLLPEERFLPYPTPLGD